MRSSIIKRVAIIGNGVAGAENQCIGLIRALGFSHPHSFYRVTRPKGGINERLHWLSVPLHRKLDHFFRQISGHEFFRVGANGNSRVLPSADNAGTSLFPEADAKQIAISARETCRKNGPLLVVASGRDTIPVASSIKRLAPEHVFVVQIQHPRSNLKRFDLVITPRHDYYPLNPQAQEQVPWFLRRWITPREHPGKNVILTVGALHQTDPIALQIAASSWHDKLAPLPKPLLVVNIGGPTSHCRYGTDLAKQLTASLVNILSNCGSVRISFSRRTPIKISDILLRAFHNNPKVHIWDGSDPNPHMGNLAWADAFVITADSVSMLSEACSTGKPVYVIGSERCTWKFADFQKSLLERGAVRPFTGKENVSERWSYVPLSDTADAAGQVINALATRGWKLEPQAHSSA
ncbi:mitochondrial fission protein ELM1-like [Apium graveolens]|uniref:mitochondrial fission protein ELM1-like n=1 Tax=Apium graveolens TaxID=4045 RepID=UPI003D7AFEA4